MGIGPEKDKIRNILIKNSLNLNEEGILRIEYKYNRHESLEEDKDDNVDNDSFDFSQEFDNNIDSPDCDIKNIKKYPYIAIGVLSVKFPISDETFFYTCFAISPNVIATLASNLEDNNKGGKLSQL